MNRLKERLEALWQKASGIAETWVGRWERSRLLLAYSQIRRRFTGAKVPGLPDTPDLDSYLFVSLGLHLLTALLLYLLAPRALSVAQHPPITVRLLETKPEAPAPGPQRELLRQRSDRAQEKPRQTQKPEAQPSQLKQDVPILTPKALPKVAAVKPEIPRSTPKTLPQAAPEGKSPLSSPESILVEKGLLPEPLKPFETQPAPGGPAGEGPRSVAAPSPAVPAPTPVTPLPAFGGTSTASSPPSTPPGMAKAEATLEGFHQPTGPVVVPERFLKGGAQSTAPRAGVELIDTSDPDFTEYFELIKRRVYAAWRYPQGVRGVYKVSVRFILDRAGTATRMEVVKSTNRELNESAVEAMRRASPFPPIPEKFRALVGQPLTLIFTVTIQ